MTTSHLIADFRFVGKIDEQVADLIRDAVLRGALVAMAPSERADSAAIRHNLRWHSREDVAEQILRLTLQTETADTPTNLIEHFRRAAANLSGTADIGEIRKFLKPGAAIVIIAPAQKTPSVLSEGRFDGIGGVLGGESPHAYGPLSVREAAEDSYEELPLWQQLLELAGEVPDVDWQKVPPDLSLNLDHYLYGAEKQTE